MHGCVLSKSGAINLKFQILMKQFCDDLLSAISHDLRGPLTSMCSLIDLIETTNDPVKKSEYLVYLRQMIQKQEGIINSIFYKVEVKSGNC